MEFEAPNGPPVDGGHRYFVLQSEGWCKDMDLYTKDGDTLGPLPGAERRGEARMVMLETFNTRFREGRD